jgi:hypothetical protein
MILNTNKFVLHIIYATHASRLSSDISNLIYIQSSNLQNILLLKSIFYSLGLKLIVPYIFSQFFLQHN